MKQRNSVWAVCVQVLDEFSMKITQREYVTQQIRFCRHLAICLSSAYTVIYLAKMSSEESSDSEIPYDSSDEVWEEGEVSSDDDSACRPGFSAHTWWAPGLHVV